LLCFGSGALYPLAAGATAAGPRGNAQILKLRLCLLAVFCKRISIKTNQKTPQQHLN
jgi:hypothetical protein